AEQRDPAQAGEQEQSRPPGKGPQRQPGAHDHTLLPGRTGDGTRCDCPRKLRERQGSRHRLEWRRMNGETFLSPSRRCTVTTRWTVLGIGLLLLAAVTLPLLRAAEKKEGKSVLPGKATWDLRAFNVFFDVVDTQYDEKANQVTWVLQTKEANRTSDFVR